MQGGTKERWAELCELAVDEQDPKRLMQLVNEINRLLGEKEAGRYRTAGVGLSRRDF